MDNTPDSVDIPKSLEGKPQRQSTACNWCRSHKVKCDTQYPSCKNCSKRGIQCVTTNLRRPDTQGRRVDPIGRRSRIEERHVGISPPTSHSSPASSHENSQELPDNLHSRVLRPISHPGPIPPIFAAPFKDGRRPAYTNHGSETYGPTRRTRRQQQLQNQGHQDPTGHTIVTDRTRSRRQLINSGSSMYVLVQWLDLFFAHKQDWSPIFPYFQQNLRYSMEMSFSFPMSLPSLPSEEKMGEYITVFFSRIFPIFPVIDEAEFSESIPQLRARLSESPQSLASIDYPSLASAYAICSLSADESEGTATDIGRQYLEGAYFLYAHLAAMPYFQSVQALILMTIALRNRNKDGASWGTLGQAIRLAQSIGLHRQVVDPQDSALASGEASSDLQSRIWWTAYILERTLELETGRPSAIRDSECDQHLPEPVLAGSEEFQFDYFGSLIRLAKIQTDAIELLHGNPRSRKTTKDMLLELGRIDRRLLDWGNDIPDCIRPGRDIFCNLDELHLATYIGLHYHQTMIALHRPALMSANDWLCHRIEEHCAGTAARHRLRFGVCITAASARAIIKQFNDLRMYTKTSSRLITVNHILLAILVLSIYVTKCKGNPMVESDFAILNTFSQVVEGEYLNLGQDVEFAKGLAVLRQQISEQMKSSNGLQTASHDDPIRYPTLMASSAPGPFDSGLLDFSTHSLDEAWSSLWTEGFNLNGFADDANQEILSTYLLGLPQMEG